MIVPFNVTIHIVFLKLVDFFQKLWPIYVTLRSKVLLFTVSLSNVHIL